MEKIRELTPRAEFIVVVSGAFGYFILVSLSAITSPSTGALISEDGLRALIIHELFVLALLAWFLRIRGWTLKRIGLTPNTSDTVTGTVIFAIFYAIYILLWSVSESIFPSLGETADSSGIIKPGFSLSTIIAISIINPIFEEAFVCGYVISALKSSQKSELFAINVSVGLRLLYHLYQGPAGLISIIPLGLIFAYWYAKTGRLWPLIVAHALLDFLGLIAYRVST